MELRNPILVIAMGISLGLGGFVGFATAASSTPAALEVVMATDDGAGDDAGGDEGPAVDVDPEGASGMDPVWLIAIVAVIVLVIVAVLAATRRRGDTTVVRHERPR